MRVLQIAPAEDPPTDSRIAAATYRAAAALLPPHVSAAILDEAAADLAAELTDGGAAQEPSVGAPPPEPVAPEQEGLLEAAVAAALGLTGTASEPASPPVHSASSPPGCSPLHLSLELQLLEALGDLAAAGGAPAPAPFSLPSPSLQRSAGSLGLRSPRRSSPALSADADADERFSSGWHCTGAASRALPVLPCRTQPAACPPQSAARPAPCWSPFASPAAAAPPARAAAWQERQQREARGHPRRPPAPPPSAARPKWLPCCAAAARHPLSRQLPWTASCRCWGLRRALSWWPLWLQRRRCLSQLSPRCRPQPRLRSSAARRLLPAVRTVCRSTAGAARRASPTTTP